MAKRALCSPVSSAALSVAELESMAANWLMDCEIREVSRNTIATRRLLLDKLVWFLRREEYPAGDTAALRAFLAYARTAHERPEGRWGNPLLKKPLRPRSLQTYFVHLKMFFAFAVAEGALAADPMARLAPAIALRPRTRHTLPPSTNDPARDCRQSVYERTSPGKRRQPRSSRQRAAAAMKQNPHRVRDGLVIGITCLALSWMLRLTGGPVPVSDGLPTAEAVGLIMAIVLLAEEARAREALVARYGPLP
jgi:hypothetical protein